MEQAQTQPQAQPQTSADWIAFLAWLEVNKKRLITGAIVALCLIAVVSLYGWYANENEAAASRALSSALTPFGGGDTASKSNLDTLKSVVSSYSGTKAATRAELEIGAALFTQGDYAGASAQFERFLREHAGSPWSGQAFFGVAACLDAQKKNDEAVKKYGDFIVRYPSDPSADQARLNQGLIYEQSQKLDKAAELYDRMTKTPGYSTASREADGRLRLLYAANPSLIPSNPPPVKPSISMTPATNRIQAAVKGATNTQVIKLSPGSNAAPAIKLAPAPAPAAPAAKK